MLKPLVAIFGCAIALSGTAALAQSSYMVVHNFQAADDGVYPAASLINVGGTLYGTTQDGGAGYGTVFSLDTASDAEKVIYSFQNASIDGAYPESSLINFKGTLYGTTADDETGKTCGSACGKLFSLDPTTDTEQVAYAFKGRKDGRGPYGGLIEVGGILYGTTGAGGDGPGCRHYGCGTIFSLDPRNGKEKVIHAFQNGADGANPVGNLINIGGTLYGVTSHGGGAPFCKGCGTVFSLDLATGAETVLYAFQDGTDGAEPYGGLINVGGALYGTTASGGGAANCSCGTVFSLDPATGAEKIVYVFQPNGIDGVGPRGSLIEVGGTLYGTTSGGGGAGPSECFGYGCGTVYSFNPTTGIEKVLHAFAGSTGDGTAPLSGLLNVGGTLYGTTNGGGSDTSCSNEYYSGCGTVFALKP